MRANLIDFMRSAKDTAIAMIRQDGNHFGSVIVFGESDEASLNAIWAFPYRDMPMEVIIDLVGTSLDVRRMNRYCAVMPVLIDCRNGAGDIEKRLVLSVTGRDAEGVALEHLYSVQQLNGRLLWISDQPSFENRGSFTESHLSDVYEEAVLMGAEAERGLEGFMIAGQPVLNERTMTRNMRPAIN